MKILKNTKKPTKQATKTSVKKDAGGYTHIVLVVDRSGSMGTCWHELVPSVNQFVDEQAAAKGKCTFSMAVFDDHYDVLKDFAPIKEVKEPLKDIKPRGWTALYDAIGKTVNSVAEKLKTLRVKPAKIVFMIQTDGHENASKEFNSDSLKKLIEEKSKENWDFVFVGTTEAAVMQARAAGITVGGSAAYDPSNSAGTVQLLSKKMLETRTLVASGMACSYDFSSTERDELLKQKK